LRHRPPRNHFQAFAFSYITIALSKTSDFFSHFPMFYFYSGPNFSFYFPQIE
jgi:hypothetical protein